MAKETETLKKKLLKKFLKFQKNGLLKYGKYLETEYKTSSKSAIKKSYNKYIENEIKRNTKKLKSIEAKL